MAPGLLVGRYRSRAKGHTVNLHYPVTLSVLGDGCLAGTIRWGTIGGRPVHSAVCGVCGALVSEQPVFEDTAVWLRDHAVGAHGIANLLVDLRLLPSMHRHCCDWRAAHVVDRLSTAWGDRESRRLVAVWWAEWGMTRVQTTDRERHTA